MRLVKITVSEAELTYAGRRGVQLADVPPDAVIVRVERRPDFKAVWEVIYYVREST